MAACCTSRLSPGALPPSPGCEQRKVGSLGDHVTPQIPPACRQSRTAGTEGIPRRTRRERTTSGITPNSGTHDTSRKDMPHVAPWQSSGLRPQPALKISLVLVS